MDKDELMERVAELFMRLGIKSLTMDDISRLLGISKKTLYKFAKDKNDLVKQTMQLAIESDQQCLSELIEKGNAIDKMVAINDQISEKLENIQPAVIFDLQKYYPEAWKIMEEHKSVFIYNQVRQNLINGIEEGLYRDNLEPELTAKIYVSLVNSIFESNLFDLKQTTYQRLHTEIARYHLRGIASERGLEYIKSLFKKIKY